MYFGKDNVILKTNNKKVNKHLHQGFDRHYTLNYLWPGCLYVLLIPPGFLCNE